MTDALASPAADADAEPPIKAVIAQVTPIQQNCTIVWCTRTLKAAVIDPGGDVPRILGALDHYGLTLEKIWITHAHIDHIGGVADLRDARPVPIEGPHRADEPLIANVAVQGERFGIPGARPFTPDRWLEDGDRVTVGETEWEVYFTPGHAPGHVIFFHRPSKFAQVGDVLFKGSVGRVDLPGGSVDVLIDSVVTKLWPLGMDVRFVPGHGPMSTFGAEKRSNPFVSDLALESASL